MSRQDQQKHCICEPAWPLFSMTSYLQNILSWFFQSDMSVTKVEPGDSQRCEDLSSYQPARLREEEYKQIPQKNSPGLLTQNHADGLSGGTTTFTAEVNQRDAAGVKSGVQEEHSSVPGGLTEAGVQESELDLTSRRLRFILMGKSGTGKSATGNSILGRQEFVSKVSTRPVTTALQRGSREWAGRELQVIDTPDIFSPEFQSGVLVEEIRQAMSSPVPYAVLLVIQLGRFTEQDRQVVRHLQETFGTGVLAHTILVFTRIEDLAGDSLDEYVKETSNQSLLELDVLCSRRHCGFNNRAQGTEQEKQLQDLMDRSEMILWEQKDRNHTRSACQCSQENILLPEIQKREKTQEQEIPNNQSSLEVLVPNLEGL